MSKIKPIYIVVLIFAGLSAGIFFMKKKMAQKQDLQLADQEVVETLKLNAIKGRMAQNFPRDSAGFYLKKDSCNFGMLYGGTRWIPTPNITKISSTSNIAVDGDERQSFQAGIFGKFKQESVHLIKFDFVSTDYSTYDVSENPNVINMDDLNSLDWTTNDVSIVLECLCDPRVTDDPTKANILYTMLKKYKGDFNPEHLQAALKCNQSDELKKIQQTLLSNASKSAIK